MSKDAVRKASVGTSSRIGGHKTAKPAGPPTQEQLREQAAIVRRAAVAKSKEKADRYRAANGPGLRQIAAAGPPAVQKTARCRACSAERALVGLALCRSCAVANGIPRCTRCRQWVQSLNEALVNGRCANCSDKPVCASCAVLPPVKKTPYCRSCALHNGYNSCADCKKLFRADGRQSRRRRCQPCANKPRPAAKRGSGSSVRTVSGGLPSLGKRH